MKDLASQGKQFGIIVDSWTNVNKENVEAICLSAGKETFILSSEICGTSQHGVSIAKFWQSIINKVNINLSQKYFLNERITTSYFVSDNAGQCGRARHILARRIPTVLFGCCWAHQVNLMVKSILKLADFNSVLKQCCSFCQFKQVVCTSLSTMPHSIRNEKTKYNLYHW
jgi:hypothetical protein